MSSGFAVLGKPEYDFAVLPVVVLAQGREANWQAFLQGERRVLVATDIASRGLDTTYVLLLCLAVALVPENHRVVCVLSWSCFCSSAILIGHTFV